MLMHSYHVHVSAVSAQLSQIGGRPFSAQEMGLGLMHLVRACCGNPSPPSGDQSPLHPAIHRSPALIQAATGAGARPQGSGAKGQALWVY